MSKKTLFNLVKEFNFLEKLYALGVEASQCIFEHAQNVESINPKQKLDHSPYTQADLDSEKILFSGLKKILPGKTTIISEENITHYSEEELQSTKEYWLIDPLDGTKDFISGSTHYAINLAFMKDQIPVLGFIFLPAHSLCYFAGKGFGAWKVNLKNKIYDAEPIKRTFVKKEKYKVAVSRSHPEEETSNWIKSHLSLQPEAIGSSYKFCLLAEGELDFYPRYSELYEWDVSAGDCIYREVFKEKSTPKPIEYKSNEVPHPRRASTFLLGYPEPSEV